MHTNESVFDSKFDSSAIERIDNESINFVDNSSLMDRVKVQRRYGK